MDYPSGISRRVVEDTVRQLIRIMTEDPLSSWSYSFPRKPSLYQNFAEPIILRKLYGEKEDEEPEPLHEYALARTCKLHRTQVTRALKSLRQKRAVRIVSATSWRSSGKEKKVYSITSLGRLLLNYQAMDTIETWDLLGALENCAIEFGSTGLENLIASIMEIEEEDKRRENTLVLLNLLLEYREKLWDRDLNWLITCDFVKNTWREKRDIAPYVGHFSDECRFLLSKTKEALAASASQVDFFLTNRALSDSN
jgi:DNA-binding PadR family transcriptional regulator